MTQQQQQQGQQGQGQVHTSPGSSGKHLGGGGGGGLSQSMSLPNLLAVSVRRDHNIAVGGGNSNTTPSETSPSLISPLSPSPSNSPAASTVVPPGQQASDRDRDRGAAGVPVRAGSSVSMASSSTTERRRAAPVRRTGTGPAVGNRKGIWRSNNRRGAGNDQGDEGCGDENEDDDDDDDDGEDARKDKRSGLARGGGGGGASSSSSSLKKGSRASQSCESLLDEMEEMDRHSDPDEEGWLQLFRTVHADSQRAMCNDYNKKI